jgi:hypothetical protein
MAAGRCDNLIGSVRFGSVRFGSVRFGSVRFGSVRFGRSIAPFSQYVKSYLITISEDLSPETGLIAPCLRLFRI